ncbi:hypothetical protein E8F12_14910 [Pseudomonas sp. BN102]|nr:hypothetical protein [Pseudomonas sp. BN102]
MFNNRIDGASVCANHKRGSIDYRECRKGAKQFFKEKCEPGNCAGKVIGRPGAGRWSKGIAVPGMGLVRWGE